MGLVTASQFNLTPDVTGSLQRGLNLGEQFRQRQLQGKQEEFLEGGGLQDPNAVQNAAKFGLDFQQQVAKGLGLQDERTGQVNQARLTEAADFSFRIQDLPIEQQNIKINERIQKLESEGRDATQSRELLTIPPERRMQSFQAVQLSAIPNEDRIKFLTGQLNRDQIKAFQPRPNEQGGLSIPTVNTRTNEVEFIPVPGSVAETAVEKGQRTAKEKKTLGQVKTTETERREVAKLTAKRKQGFVDSGIEAADSVANVRRSIDLLKDVKTGGFDAAALRAKQIFGVESADEAELSSGLGKAILAQLRPLFGAAFTENEGKRLERIEAGFGKSTAGNKRLLNQLLKIVQRSAKRGIAAAEDLGDDFTANEIRAALALDIAPTEPTTQTIGRFQVETQ